MKKKVELVDSATMHFAVGFLTLTLALGWFLTAAGFANNGDPWQFAAGVFASLLVWVVVGLADVAKALERIEEAYNASNKSERADGVGRCTTEDTLFHD